MTLKTAHRALRDGTSAAHDRVDALYGRFDLADRESYGAFLSAHAEALLPLEAALDAAGAEQVIEDWPERKRGHLLREDLAMLGRPRPAPAAAEAGDNAWAAGTIYVLEGSRLGGKFLARSLPPRFPRAYVDADQPTGNWPVLLDRLDSILRHPPALDDAIGAALAAFAAFERSGRSWLRN